MLGLGRRGHRAGRSRSVQIQRSEDGGTTWTTIQGAADADILADPHTVSIYDHHR